MDDIPTAKSRERLERGSEFTWNANVRYLSSLLSYKDVASSVSSVVLLRSVKNEEKIGRSHLELGLFGSSATRLPNRPKCPFIY
jgi:hypothetical protein